MFSCHKFEIKLKEMGKVNNSGYIQHLKLFKLSKCKQHSHVRKKINKWVDLDFVAHMLKGLVYILQFPKCQHKTYNFGLILF